jgi:hypothetical protein
LPFPGSRPQHSNKSCWPRRRWSTKLGLTDLALFTESRYTRHPTQADLHSALQDHPGAFDHFPTGSCCRRPPF